MITLSWTSSLNPDYDQIIEIDLVNGISGQKDNPSLRDTLTNIEHIIYEGSVDVEMTGDGNNNIINLMLVAIFSVAVMEMMY